MDRRRCRGFVTYEPLIHIAIIGLLLAILFPALAKARDRARSTTCQSNLRQLGSALRLYAQDYDGRLPAAAADPLPAPVQDGPPSLSLVLAPYVPDPDQWRCRADNGIGEMVRPSAYTELGSSYVYRAEWARFDTPLAALPPRAALLADASDTWHPKGRRTTLFADGNARALLPDAFRAVWNAAQPDAEPGVGESSAPPPAPNTP